MSDLRIQATVSADGKQASAELKKLAGDIGRTKQEMVEAQAASRAAAAALKSHSQAASEDTAQQQRLRDALIAARTAEAEATRSHALAAAAMSRSARGAQELGQSTGQARASMANLGQQVGDVAQGIAMGVPAFTLLAQQGGQVAFAMSGLGGAVGRVASFLSGPWGAAILGGAIVLGSLAAASDKAAVADDKQLSAKERLQKAIKDFREASQQASLSQEQLAQESLRQAQIDVKAAEAKRVRIRELIAEARAELELQRVRATAPGQRGEVAALGLDVASRRAASLDALQASNEAAIRNGNNQIQRDLFALGTKDAKARDDVARAALAAERAEARLRREVEAGTKTAAAATAELGRYLAAVDRAREARGAAGRAERAAAKSAKDLADENRQLAEAYNPLLAAQADYKKSLEDIATAEARGIASAGQAADARAASAEALRQARLKALGATPTGPIQLASASDLGNDLSAQSAAGDRARELEAVVAKIGRDFGITSAKDFGREALQFSQVIGNGLAGGFARALQRSTAIAALMDRLAPGQGGVVQSAAASVTSDAANRVGNVLGKVFGTDGAFGKTLGKALGGAQVGAATADIVNALGISKNKKGAQIGGQIGGAIGSFIPIPGGQIIGSVLGSLVGGAIKGKNPFADSRLTTSANGVDSSIFNQRGADSANQGKSIAGSVGSQLSQIASALGAEIKAGINLGAIGFSGDQFYFNRTGGDFKGAGAQKFASAEEAVAAAVANALSTGAIATSPRVQSVLQRYASNVNQAVAEALKVRDLEQLLEARGNPFLSAFREFEKQARQRVDVARQYGFDVLEIEKLNAEQRAAIVRETLQGATGSARALLDEFRFGERAGGSVRDQLTSLGGERDRLASLVRGGDGSQLDKLAEVIRQIDDLQREAFGATGEAANGRAASAALLQELIDATEARVRAAAEEAQRAAAQQINTLQSMDSTLEDIFRINEGQLSALQGIAAALAGSAGGGSVGFEFGLASSVARG